MHIPKAFPYFMQTTAWLLLWHVILRDKLLVRGQENLAAALAIHKSTQRGIVFAANHMSELDPALVFVGLSPWRRREFPTYFVSGVKNMFKHPKFGWRRFIYGGFIFHISGSFPLRPSQKDYAESLKTHIAILSTGNNVCIFPQGKMVKDGELPRAHGGVAYLAEAGGAPILPVAISRSGAQTIVEYLPLVWVSELMSNPSDPERYRHAAEEIMQRINTSRAAH